MAVIALWSHCGLSQELMESSSRRIRQRDLAVRLRLPGYPPELFVACQKSLILIFGNYERTLDTVTTTYFYLHRDLPPFIILCANISFYNLAWDTNGLQITSAIQSAWKKLGATEYEINHIGRAIHFAWWTHSTIERVSQLAIDQNIEEPFARQPIVVYVLVSCSLSTDEENRRRRARLINDLSLMSRWGRGEME